MRIVFLSCSALPDHRADYLDLKGRSGTSSFSDQAAMRLMVHHVNHIGHSQTLNWQISCQETPSIQFPKLYKLRLTVCQHMMSLNIFRRIHFVDLRRLPCHSCLLCQLNTLVTSALVSLPVLPRCLRCVEQTSTIRTTSSVYSILFSLPVGPDPRFSSFVYSTRQTGFISR